MATTPAGSVGSGPSHQGESVCAAVVLHNPEPELLAAQRAATAAQVAELLYVDNGGGRAAAAVRAGDLAVADGLVWLGDGTNPGLAAGLNLALRAAVARGHAWCLLLDQDSIPDPGLVSTLREGAQAAPDILAAGPAIRDEHTGVVEHFARLRLPLNRRITPADVAPDAFFDVDFLITSGTLVRLGLLHRAGWMDEDLFIDCVDFDWSFRARSRGLRLVATFATQLRHRRGDAVVRLPGMALRLHSASRLAYMHRNRVRLYRRRYVPLAWKVHDLARLVVKLALLLAFVPGRRERVAAVLRGLREGLA